MSFFWPKTRRTQDSIAVRLGRLVHWVAVAIGVGLVILALSVPQSAGAQTNTILACAVAGIIVALIGRGLRYVLSGE